VIRTATALLATVWLATSCGNSGCSCDLDFAPPPSVSVFAASSLKPAFDKMREYLLGIHDVDLTFNYAGTQTLASQLIQGASGDVFASADTAHMDSIENAGLAVGPATVFAHNRLEIAVAKGNPKGIHTLNDLSRADLVVVLADPSVPAGKYAAQALKNAGVSVHPASLELEVTGVLTKVALGEADAGIVYVSDIATSGKVDGVTIPDNQNVVADYTIVALKSARYPAAASGFVSFVGGPYARSVLTAAGFEGV
jgi:molybdate transport system substrate-binding protein